jgi:hypothetical protein
MGMRRVVFCLLSVVLLALAPALVSAQILSEFGAGAGFPSLGGIFRGGAGGPFDPSQGCGLTFDVGYLGTNHIKGTSETQALPIVPGVRRIQIQYNLDGIWLALSANSRLGDCLGLYARGAFLAPFNHRAEEVYSGGVVVFSTSRTWATSTQWYDLDVGGTFSCYGGTELIGGFRFDSFSTNLSDAADAVGFVSLNTDTADSTIRSYIPYVGLMVNQGNRLRVSLIGFPYVPGDLTYHETTAGTIRTETTGSLRNSYFLEASAEYGRDLMGGSFGLFGTWSYLSVRSNQTAVAKVGGVTLNTQPYRFDLCRQSYILGAKFAINFFSPF